VLIEVRMVTSVPYPKGSFNREQRKVMMKQIKKSNAAIKEVKVQEVEDDFKLAPLQ